MTCCSCILMKFLCKEYRIHIKISNIPATSAESQSFTSVPYPHKQSDIMGSPEKEASLPPYPTSDFKLTLHRIPLSPPFASLQAADNVNIDFSPGEKSGEGGSPTPLKPYLRRKSRRFCLWTGCCLVLWSRRKHAAVAPASYE